MVAIQRELLSHQLEGLVKNLDYEDEFISGLHDLLNYYSDRVYHPGETGLVKHSIPTYRVPEPLIPMIARKLLTDVSLKTEDYQRLVDCIWEENWLETKLLAIELARVIYSRKPDILYAYFCEWNQEHLDRTVAQNLGTALLEPIIPVYSAEVLEYLDGWSFDDPRNNRNAFMMMRVLVDNPEFENLPGIYLIFTKMLRHLNTNVMPDAVRFLTSLIERSPVEAVYYLRQQSVVTTNDLFSNLVRKAANQSPSRYQVELQEILRERKK